MLQLRPPKADEGSILTALCLRSKAAHGYSDAFLEACIDELTVHTERPNLIVAELDGVPVGVAELSIAGDRAALEKLFVDPACHGQGVGRALFEWSMKKAAEKGARTFTIDSDPGAVAFYEKMGATVTGKSPSGSIPGRFLPKLELELEWRTSGGGSTYKR